jgi:alkanesulfonate monooxygenase SsuD/methylene tetrahydromethanopterin reductase-like flavin-dependent oxidoreductase (luciferase family)
MLEEAVEVMRKLWTGEVLSHRGQHYMVDTARIYTLPDQPVRVYVSGFGPKAVDLAARIGDGYVTTMPDKELVDRFKDAAGRDRPTQAGYKVSYAASRVEGVEIALGAAFCRIDGARLDASRRVSPRGRASRGLIRLSSGIGQSLIVEVAFPHLRQDLLAES